MEQEVKRLIELGVLICGRITKEDGVVRFNRTTLEELNMIPQNERGYATSSMGRAVFTIDENGVIHNFKGVDSQLNINKNELGMVDLIDASIVGPFCPGKDCYNISAFFKKSESDTPPEIRINGTSPLEDIEIESELNNQLSKLGVCVPRINYIKELPQEYCLKHGLPIKVEGNLSEFDSKYADEDEQRKETLTNIFGDYQDLNNNQKPETLNQYLTRIGFYSNQEIVNAIKTKSGIDIDTFVKNIDNSYSRGQRYGQAERIIDSPFRISDLEICINNGNIEQLKAIIDFTEKYNEGFINKSAEIFGNNIAILINNGWEIENLQHRQDFSITGEFCDDSYFDIIKKQESLKKEFTKEEKMYKFEPVMNEIKRRYTGQVMHVSSCIIVFQLAMILVGKSKEEIMDVLNIYTDSFVNNLDFEKIGELLNKDELSTCEDIMKQFGSGQDWALKMAKLDRKDDVNAMNIDIYNYHKGYNDLYENISKMISSKIYNRVYGLDQTSKKR